MMRKNFDPVLSGNKTVIELSMDIYNRKVFFRIMTHTMLAAMTRYLLIM